MKISKRDMKAFLIGMLAMLAIISAFDWEHNVAEFKKGFDEGMAAHSSDH